jgi:hypothetical protein
VLALDGCSPTTVVRITGPCVIQPTAVDERRSTGPDDVLDAYQAAWQRGEPVAMVLRETVVRGESRLELRRVNIYRVEGGKITEIDIYEAHQYEVDECFA